MWHLRINTGPASPGSCPPEAYQRNVPEGLRRRLTLPVLALIANDLQGLRRPAKAVAVPQVLD